MRRGFKVRVRITEFAGMGVGGKRDFDLFVVQSEVGLCTTRTRSGGNHFAEHKKLRHKL